MFLVVLLLPCYCEVGVGKRGNDVDVDSGLGVKAHTQVCCCTRVLYVFMKESYILQSKGFWDDVYYGITPSSQHALHCKSGSLCINVGILFELN